MEREALLRGFGHLFTRSDAPRSGHSALGWSEEMQKRRPVSGGVLL